jgi:RNA polymerase sigma-70 factor, ECF subfamily
MGPDLATVSDVDLLARIVDGDPAAVAQLYDRYAGLLAALALRILRDRAECEDTLHDVFVLLGERARHYVPERGSVAAWLVTLVRNLSIDRMRRRERRGAITRDILAHEPGAAEASAEADPETQVVDAAEGARVRAALAALPPAQRGTLELSFFSGLSYPEIAEKENLPLGTIKSRAARALAALREALEKDSASPRSSTSPIRGQRLG